jgi:hypothetical protein
MMCAPIPSSILQNMGLPPRLNASLVLMDTTLRESLAHGIAFLLQETYSATLNF